MRALALAVALLAAVYLLLCGLLFVFQRSLLYSPQPDHLPRAAKLELPTPDGHTRVTVRELPGPRALLYFGGNGEDTALSLATFSEAFPEHSLYLLHYRGYGQSSGKPSEAGLHADALALFDHAERAHREVSVLGRSLGTGVAVRLASERPVAKLALVTPYDSIERLAGAQFAWFPVTLILRDKFDSWSTAPRVKAPTLLLSAEWDEVIPTTNTRALLASFAPGVARLTVIPRANHNSLSEDADYLRLLQAAL